MYTHMSPHGKCCSLTWSWWASRDKTLNLWILTWVTWKYHCPLLLIFGCKHKRDRCSGLHHLGLGQAPVAFNMSVTFSSQPASTLQLRTAWKLRVCHQRARVWWVFFLNMKTPGRKRKWTWTRAKAYDPESQVQSHSSFLTPRLISWLELHGKLKSKKDLFRFVCWN